jgi:hypothetical protein
MRQIREYVDSNEECSAVLNLDGTKFSTTTSMVLTVVTINCPVYFILYHI